MRIHDATTGFIKSLKKLGYDHPSIDQLVTMRIHEVTPEYIQRGAAHSLQTHLMPEGVAVQADLTNSVYTVTITSLAKGQVKDISIVFLGDGTIRRLVISEQNGDRADGVEQV